MSRLAALKNRGRVGEPDVETPTMSTELGLAMIEASVPKALIERLKQPGPFAMILLVPSYKHIDLVSEGVERLMAQNGTAVPVSGTPNLSSAEFLIDILGRSRVAVAVTNDVDSVPATFKALADSTVVLKPHDAAMLRRALRRTMGKPIPGFPPGFVVHPNPDLLCRCVLPNLAPARVVSALAQLGGLSNGANEESLPALSDCVEFGKAREWGLRVIDDLAAYRRGDLRASDLDASCLLVSPPGHGKTYFARVLAKAMGVPLIELSVGSIFVDNGYLGDVLQAIRKQFADAAAAAPAVLLLDELDSFSRRDAKDNNRSFTTSMINELLTLIDGASQRRPGLVVIGATNMPDAIDPALRRPGRLSTTIGLGLPGAEGIEHVLRFHLRGDLADCTLAKAVRMASGLTPAKLMDIVRAARQRARSAGRHLAEVDLERAICGEPLKDGPFIKRVALHEAGHALASLLIPEAPYLHSISLISNDRSQARVRTMEQEGANTRSIMEARIMMALAGRAAEDVVFGDDRSDGACEDLKVATALVCRLHGQFGMGSTLVHHQNLQGLLARDPEFASKVEAELQRLLAKVTDLLANFQVYLLALASELLRRRFLTGREAMLVLEAVQALALQAEEDASHVETTPSVH